MHPRTIRELFVRFVKHMLTHSGEKTIRVNKIMFGLQEAYWFYKDYMVGLDSESLVTFARFVHNFSNQLQWSHEEIRNNVKQFRKHLQMIPRCGGILLNSCRTKTILVRGIGSRQWTFPAGKIDLNENNDACAEREVFEETGFQGCVASKTNFLEFKKRKVCYTLFEFANVPDDYDFAPQTRNEIADIQWFELCNLNEVLSDKLTQQVLQFVGYYQSNPNPYTPFVPLRQQSAFEMYEHKINVVEN